VAGRFVSEDLIGNDTGLNLYVYVHNRPPGFRDPSGFYNLAGFLPEQQQQLTAAINSAIQTLKKDCPSCAGDAAPKIIKALQSATYVYIAGLKDEHGSELCASAAPLTSKTISVSDIALKGKCCRLDSTLAHEAMHKALQSNIEKLMRDMEEKCFGCTWTPPSF
jgi:hypothetical protein